MQTIIISTCPLEIVARTGKLIPTIIKELGLIQKRRFFIINQVNDEKIEREIKLKRFFENSYGNVAKGANK